MGWAAGSEILCEVASSAQKAMGEHVSKDDRVEFYAELIEVFTQHDCDTIEECRGVDPALDVAVSQYMVEWMRGSEYNDADEVADAERKLAETWKAYLSDEAT